MCASGPTLRIPILTATSMRNMIVHTTVRDDAIFEQSIGPVPGPVQQACSPARTGQTCAGEEAGRHIVGDHSVFPKLHVCYPSLACGASAGMLYDYELGMRPCMVISENQDFALLESPFAAYALSIVL